MGREPEHHYLLPGLYLLCEASYQQEFLPFYLANYDTHRRRLPREYKFLHEGKAGLK